MYFSRNKKYLLSIIFCLILSSLFSQGTKNKPNVNSTSGKVINANNINIKAPSNKAWYKKIDELNFSDIKLRDILQSVAIQNNLNVIADKNITGQVSIHLKDISIWDLFQYLSEEYNLKPQWKGSILLIKMAEIQAVEEKKKEVLPGQGELKIELTGNLMSIEAKDFALAEALDIIADSLQINILVEQDIEKSVTGRLKNLDKYLCLKTFLEYNNLVLQRIGDVFHVYSAFNPSGEGEKSKYKQWIGISEDNLISLNIIDCPVDKVIREIVEKSNFSLINYSKLNGVITAKTSKLSFDNTLDILLRNTDLTYRFDNGIYYLGSRNLKGMSTKKLIKLNHIKSDGAIELLPKSIVETAEIKEIKELNSIMVIATRDIVEEIKKYIQEIDHISPQILLEVVAVDYTVTDMKELDLKFGTDNSAQATPLSFFPFVSGTATKSSMNHKDSPGMITHNLGLLPDNFYMTLKAMEQEGFAKINSKPHISTLNGHTASINIFTTKYYLLESNSVTPTTGNPIQQSSQRFEKVKAETKLEITPWVSADGEVTVKIKPEFSTPVGGFDVESSTPPTINSRILESTVRLKDGETIVLGGLITDTNETGYSKFPVLGNLPIIGALFRGFKKNNQKTELVFYITPHVNLPPVKLEKELEERNTILNEGK